MKKSFGFTYVELIIFIIIMSILAGAILLASSNALKYSVTSQKIFLANELAASCAEWFIGQRNSNSFNSPNLNCGVQGANYCSDQTQSPPYSGYYISENIDCAVSNFKSITIKVTGKGNAEINLTLANY